MRNLIKALDASVRFIAVVAIVNLVFIGLGVCDHRRWPTEDDENKYKIVPLMPKEAP